MRSSKLRRAYALRLLPLLLLVLLLVPCPSSPHVGQLRANDTGCWDIMASTSDPEAAQQGFCSTNSIMASTPLLRLHSRDICSSYFLRQAHPL
jgi:hypothetical protein